MALKAKSDQEVLVEMIKGHENDLMRNKDGSYIIKEIYRNFDRCLSKKITEVFMKEFQVNITDKYAICIFKEIAQAMSEDMGQLDELLPKNHYHNIIPRCSRTFCRYVINKSVNSDIIKMRHIVNVIQIICSMR